MNEFRLALSAFGERPPSSIYLIPVRLDDCDVPDLQIPDRGLSLQDIQWVDLWQEGGFDRLVKAIERALEGLVNPRQARGAAIPLAEPRAEDARERVAPEAAQEQVVISSEGMRNSTFVAASGGVLMAVFVWALQTWAHLEILPVPASGFTVIIMILGIPSTTGVPTSAFGLPGRSPESGARPSPCELERSPAFPRFSAPRRSCNGRYGIGTGALRHSLNYDFSFQFLRHLVACHQIASGECRECGNMAS